MCLMGKKKLMFLSLFFVMSFIFAEEQLRGKMIIMGWRFTEEDTATQTNMAVNAIIRYAEAARFQMSSNERYNPSCKIELYRVYKDDFYNGEIFEDARVYIYINNILDDIIKMSNGIFFNGGNDYHDRYIEIDFYIFYNGMSSKYKLVLYYNDYNWIENNRGNNQYELISMDDTAYDFFIYEIEKLRRR